MDGSRTDRARRDARAALALTVTAGWVAAALGACAASVPLTPLETLQARDYGRGGGTVTLPSGDRVAYVDRGPRGGRHVPLVLVHPWAGDVLTWEAVAPGLEADRRVIRVDLPGHGKSTLAPARAPLGPHDRRFTVDRAARAVEGVLDHLGVRRFDLVGNSLGGGVALAVARDRPGALRRLVLIDALGGGPVPGLFAAAIRTYFTTAMFLGVDDGLVEFFSNTFVFERTGRWTDRFLGRLLSNRRAGDGVAWARGVADALVSALDYDATPWLARVQAPTLVVWGDDDWVIWEGAGEHLRDHIPGARLVELEDCGHMPEVECPDALVETLRGFLDEPSPGDTPARPSTQAPTPTQAAPPAQVAPPEAP